MIQLITFDLDDTLWDNGPVIRKAVSECYNWLLKKCPELVGVYDAGTLNQLKDDIKNTVPELAHRVSEVRVVGMQRALEQVGYQSGDAIKLAREAFQVFQHWRHEVELFNGAEIMLAELSAKYPLAVITNGNADVSALGLGHYFRFSVSAEDLNRSKPDPVVFQHALKVAGVNASCAVHIGDNLITDVQGAAEAGMRTVWFNPKGAAAHLMQKNAEPDQVVSSLADIPAAVESIFVSNH
ncbi:HAD family hydrolase [Sansalvadorimonas verongulae]|uniref:HAD family hydrolase n=1 Tax=Sansalvadorimonas verongulae TaxID=2172824 RepID=UPI0012BB7A90|nr:HAD-IA family hydrolase [Sansalvadorimonas verongulae]MTI14611.1 HAD family hydrolase [Sansalvadorimonas verongulae]